MTWPSKAHGWGSMWADLDALPEYWRVPEPAVLAWAGRLRQASGRRVLDLGCGIGRHTVALPFTFVWPHETDKSLFHHRCDEAELRDLDSPWVTSIWCAKRTWMMMARRGSAQLFTSRRIGCEPPDWGSVIP